MKTIENIKAIYMYNEMNMAYGVLANTAYSVWKMKKKTRKFSISSVGLNTFIIFDSFQVATCKIKDKSILRGTHFGRFCCLDKATVSVSSWSSPTSIMYASQI